MNIPRPGNQRVEASDKRERRQGQWFWRRLMIIALSVFCMTLETYLAWYGHQDGELHKLQAEAGFWVLIGLAFMYIFGATAQDVIALVTAVRGGVIATRATTTVEVSKTTDKREIT